MIDPAVKSSKTAVEQHHLYPRGYLTQIGIKEVRHINQIANFAVVEWPDKAKISDQLPQTFLRGVPLGCLRMARITSSLDFHGTELT